MKIASKSLCFSTGRLVMSSHELEKRVAYLESVNDQLASEIRYVDRLLRSIGFPDGLATVKTAAQELMEVDGQDPENPESDYS